MRIGVGRRVGLKNSQDCDDRILARRNGDDRAAVAARTFRIYLYTLNGPCGISLKMTESCNSAARARVQLHFAF